MADKATTTTSSKSLDGNESNPGPSAPLPRQEEARLLTRLAANLTESYQLVKQRQQKYNELSARIADPRPPLTTEWQEVTSKNKLKRKKKLSASLTSVSDSVNQEKRTRIEGIQLNCRGRLSGLESAPASVPSTPSAQRAVVAKPPLPPAGRRDGHAAATATGQQTEAKAPPPRLKRRLQENVQTIQKLNALAEQMRLEINELKSSLTTERGAVRALRAQNESETRKWKNEVKKLQHALELAKKPARKPQDAPADGSAAASGPSSEVASHEIQRLTNEIITLREANKALEEKRTINCDADRRKAADIRELRDSYEIRLTQLTKSAKTEISRLLEEIKTKERNIGQLKKELQQQQPKVHQIPSIPTITTKTTKSRNATKTNTTTNKTTNTNQTNKNAKPNKNNNEKKKSQTKPQQEEEKKKHQQSQNEVATTQETNQDSGNAPHTVQDQNEMKPLKDLELINNTKNLQQQINTTTTTTTNNNNNLVHKTTKIFSTSHNSKLKIQEATEIIKCDIGIAHSDDIHSSQNNNNNNNNNNNDNMLDDCLLRKGANNNNNNNSVDRTNGPNDLKEHHSLPHDLLAERFMGEENEYRGKDHHNSDSDSALSSAPPSISPQPPPSGLEPGDIWQTLRNYSSDMEKLQKDLELMQKENEELRRELALAKEQILESEKTARTANNGAKLQQLMERVKYLEEQEHQLLAESSELREQNELLEFRILELEDSSDKWSPQSHGSNQSPSADSAAKDVWACGAPTPKQEEDPMKLLFGPAPGTHLEPAHLEERLGAISPCDLNMMEHLSNDELRRRLAALQRRLPCDEDEKQCLQQLMALLQNLDALSQGSGPGSLSAASSGDEPSSLDLVKSRASDYSSASSSASSTANSTASASSTSSSTSTASECLARSKSSAAAAPPAPGATGSPRIVATVLPYSGSGAHAHAHAHHAPNNTPTESPSRKPRAAWQSNSLSESGVFVESDFLSDAGESHAGTQTDFEEVASKELPRLPPPLGRAQPPSPASPGVCDPKRLQYYKERLELLERKVLVYESSGDLQAKRLAERLQREIQLERQVKDLRDRVDFLEAENATLEEEKCEFEEAENDTRLRLQRLEVELEILGQRNVELEMSREALSAKYKDCRSECHLLRDDLSVSETQIRHLEEDKQKAKENLEALYHALPLFVLYGTVVVANRRPQAATESQEEEVAPKLEVSPQTMGNVLGPVAAATPCERSASLAQFEREEAAAAATATNQTTCADSSGCQQRELHYLKEEVKCLRHQIKELNARHYEAMESADTHWVDLEREYKDREEAFRAKECCLKQKIARLQDCLRDDARAANEKILQLEEAEKELKCCVLRLSKEHRELVEEHRAVQAESGRLREQLEQLQEQQQPLKDALEAERKSNKGLSDELNFMRRLQQESETRSLQEAETLRTQLFELKKEFLHIEVTNSELREEVATLEQQLEALQSVEKECVDKIRVLTDEVRSKEELCAKLEKRLERSEGHSLAHELSGSPSKRFKREDVKDLQSASRGLSSALRQMKDCERALPSHQQFQSVARDVKKLADTLLGGSAPSEDEAVASSTPKLILTEITRI